MEETIQQYNTLQENLVEKFNNIETEIKILKEKIIELETQISSNNEVIEEINKKQENLIVLTDQKFLIRKEILTIQKELAKIKK
jgi:chromosome segregation ATPase